MAIHGHCPKCESGSISGGPRFWSTGYDGEWLVYNCTCCGYEEHMRPKDWKEPEKQDLPNYNSYTPIARSQ